MGHVQLYDGGRVTVVKRKRGDAAEKAMDACRGAVLKTLGACCWAVLCVAAAGCSSSSHPVHFPHAFPESLTHVQTNVSSGQAFRDNHISIPPDATGLGYDASHDQYGYIVDAAFTMPCGDVPGFVRANSLSAERGSQEQWALKVSYAADLAKELGWKSSDPSARAYHLNDNYEIFDVIITGSSECRVYLSLAGDSL